MKKFVSATIAAGFGLLLITGAGTAVRAQVQQTQTPTQNQPAAQSQPPPKHDSNSLHKWGNAFAYPFKKAGKNTAKAAKQTGKAIEYPVRKAGENASITAHKATGKSSVVHNRQTGQTVIETPSTTVTPAPSNSK
jgi:spermidine/putrescine-binding protein